MKTETEMQEDRDTIDGVIGLYNRYGLRNINDAGIQAFLDAEQGTHPKLAAKFRAEHERRQCEKCGASE